MIFCLVYAQVYPATFRKYYKNLSPCGIWIHAYKLEQQRFHLYEDCCYPMKGTWKDSAMLLKRKSKKHFLNEVYYQFKYCNK